MSHFLKLRTFASLNLPMSSYPSTFSPQNYSCAQKCVQGSRKVQSTCIVIRDWTSFDHPTNPPRRWLRGAEKHTIPTFSRRGCQRSQQSWISPSQLPHCYPGCWFCPAPWFSHEGTSPAAPNKRHVDATHPGLGKVSLTQIGHAREDRPSSHVREVNPNRAEIH